MRQALKLEYHAEKNPGNPEILHILLTKAPFRNSACYFINYKMYVYHNHQVCAPTLASL